MTRPTLDRSARLRRCCCTTTSTAGCGRRRSSSWPKPRATTRCRRTMPASWREWMTRGANRSDLVLYLETFVHTVGVMQTREALIRVGARVRGRPRGRRRRVRRGAVRARTAHRARASPSTRSSKRCSKDSGRAARAPASRFACCAPRCARPRSRSRSPSSRFAGATKACAASTSPAPRPAIRPPGTSTRSSS